MFLFGLELFVFAWVYETFKDSSAEKKEEVKTKVELGFGAVETAVCFVKVVSGTEEDILRLPACMLKTGKAYLKNQSLAKRDSENDRPEGSPSASEDQTPPSP